MKTTLLLFFLGIFCLTAQTTHDLDWSLASGTSLDLTIDQGDTVRWTWTDSAPHTTTSTSGVDSFDSGTITGNGSTFSYTFNIVGGTSYRCEFHPGTMSGTITVLSTASLEDYQKVVFSFSPNPVQNQLTINAERAITQVEIYSILGQKILSKEFNSELVKIDITAFKRNLYFTKLKFDDGSYGVFRLLKE